MPSIANVPTIKFHKTPDELWERLFRHKSSFDAFTSPWNMNSTVKSTFKHSAFLISVNTRRKGNLQIVICVMMKTMRFIRDVTSLLKSIETKESPCRWWKREIEKMNEKAKAEEREIWITNRRFFLPIITGWNCSVFSSIKTSAFGSIEVDVEKNDGKLRKSFVNFSKVKCQLFAYKLVQNYEV